ncbi:MAG: GDSL-type esterase/lipase family protein [Planctomycetota bacterium]
MNRTPWPLKLCLSTTVALVTAVVGLLSLEVYLRVQDKRAGRAAESYLPGGGVDAGLSMYMGHPYLAYTLRPGATRGEPDAMFYQTINEDGFRGRRLAVPKPPRTYRVLCVGGSTTFGTGARRDERSYPAVLESLLAEHAPQGWTVEVGNAGVPGYTTMETLINLTFRLDRYDPDLVIVYHAANDALVIRTPEFQRDYSHARRHFELPEPTELERRVLTPSRVLARLLRPESVEESPSVLHQLVFTDRFETRTQPMTAAEKATGVRVFGRNLRAIASLMESRGVDLLLQTFCMDPSQDKQGRYRELVQLLNAETQRVAAEYDLTCVDVAAALDGRSNLFDDWMHLNDEGSRLHASGLMTPTLRVMTRRFRSMQGRSPRPADGSETEGG